MHKRATTVEEQIELLKSRGMSIANEEKAREHLLDIGYYRLGFYWYYFFKDKVNQEFYNGTDITDAIDLYYLDMDLRNLLLKYIYRIEVHFRTQVVYHMSNEYKEDPFWFYKNEIIEYPPIKVFNSLKETNIHIKKHHKKYPNHQYAPAWKKLEFLTFGQILKIYQNIKNEPVKSQIARIYKLKNTKVNKKKKGRRFRVTVKDYEVLTDYFIAILSIRNICSHSNVLFDFKQPKSIRKIPDINYRPKNFKPHNLNASIYMIYFILSKISRNRTDELKQEVEFILNRAIKKNIKLKSILEEHSGFDI